VPELAGRTDARFRRVVGGILHRSPTRGTRVVLEDAFDSIEQLPAGRSPQAVVPDLDEARRKNMLKEASDELKDLEPGVVSPAGLGLLPAEGDGLTVERLDRAIIERDAVEVASEVTQASDSGVKAFDVYNPATLGAPDLVRNELMKAGFLEYRLYPPAEVRGECPARSKNFMPH
jgi:hypothetical protein